MPISKIFRTRSPCETLKVTERDERFDRFLDPPSQHLNIDDELYQNFRKILKNKKKIKNKYGEKKLCSYRT